MIGSMSAQPAAALEEQAWQAVLQRDGGFSATLVYGVTSTGIFCRFHCPSRRPARENTVIFQDAEAAARAGYRPCKRCRPADRVPGAETVETITTYLNRNADRLVPLAELARKTLLSPFTVQRLFRSVTGVTPAQYQRQLRAALLRKELRKPGQSVTAAIYDAGYASSSRAYEGIAGRLGMAPRQVRSGARGLRIGYVTAECPVGRLLLAATGRGICAVLLGGSDAELIEKLRKEFAAAEIAEDAALATLLDAVLSQFSEHPAALDLPLDLRATAFQMRVWEALKEIPRGETRSYAEVARTIGKPSAVRAVARACASNPAALVVPCHRVVGSNGALTGYRWGMERKRQLLEIEGRRG